MRSHQKYTIALRRFFVLNVLHVSSRADIGGGPKHLLDLMTEFEDFPSISCYVAVPRDGFYSEAISSSSKDCFFLPHRRFKFIILIRLIAFCYRNNIDIVHSHGRGAGVYGRVLTLFGFKSVHTFHGAHFEKSLVGITKLWLDRLLARLTTSFICVSNDEYRMVKSLGLCRSSSNISIINNGVRYGSHKNKYTYISAAPIELICLARLTYQKGIDQLIFNISKCTERDDCPSFILRIFGDGEDKAILQKKIDALNLQGSIVLAGVTSEVSKRLFEADVYISSARWEGLPLSVLEAMAVGLPCLLSKTTGHLEFAKGDGCQLYEMNSTEDFCDKLIELLNSSQNRAALGMRGRALVQRDFGLKQMVRKTADVYCQVC